MSKLSFNWQPNMHVRESLNWRERNITLDDFKNICFLDQDVNRGNLFVV